jgi:uncharacterized membrane protein
MVNKYQTLLNLNLLYVSAYSFNLHISLKHQKEKVIINDYNKYFVIFFKVKVSYEENSRSTLSVQSAQI